MIRINLNESFERGGKGQETTTNHNESVRSLVQPSSLFFSSVVAVPQCLSAGVGGNTPGGCYPPTPSNAQSLHYDLQMESPIFDGDEEARHCGLARDYPGPISELDYIWKGFPSSFLVNHITKLLIRTNKNGHEMEKTPSLPVRSCWNPLAKEKECRRIQTERIRRPDWLDTSTTRAER